MENKAVPQGSFARGLRSGSLVFLAAALALLACLGGTALAARHQLVGSDGKIHACYRVKGKPKGMVRVVRGGNYRCRRGERRMAWSVAAVAGAPGAAGPTGSQGDPGAGGAAGTGGDEAALKAQVGELSLKVNALEGVLAGITNEDLSGALNTLQGIDNGDLTGALETLEGIDNEDLTGMLDTLEGLTNGELTEAVDALPAVEALCENSEEVTEQVNLVAEAVEGLGLNGVLTGIGGLLKIPPLPEALEPFSC